MEVKPQIRPRLFASHLKQPLESQPPPGSPPGWPAKSCSSLPRRPSVGRKLPYREQVMKEKGEKKGTEEKRKAEEEEGK